MEERYGKIMRNIWKRTLSAALTAAMAVSMAVPAADAASIAADQDSQKKDQTARVIVQYENRAAAQKAQKSLTASLSSSKVLGAQKVTQKLIDFDESLAYGSIMAQGCDTEELMDYVRNQSGVVSVTEDHQKKLQEVNDPYYKYQWHLKSSGIYKGNGNRGYDIDVESVWNTGVTGSDNVVAVIDSGVDYQNEDLSSNMWINNTALTGLRGMYGYDFGDGDADPMDTVGHGTHVAGIIGAVGNNGKGVSGVNQKIKIMALKVVDSSGMILDSYILNAYQYIYKAQCAGVPVKAINVSLGPEDPSSRNTNEKYSSAVAKVGKMGAVFCMAAGNDSYNITDGYFDCKKSVRDKYAITVGAINEDGQPASYTNYSSSVVDVMAPGTSILSTYNEPALIPGIQDSATLARYTSDYHTFDTSADASAFHLFDYPYENEITTSNWSDRVNFTVTNLKSGSLTVSDGSSRYYNGIEVGYEIPEEDLSKYSTSKTYYFECMVDTDYAGEWQHYSFPARVRTINSKKYLVIMKEEYGSYSPFTFNNKIVISLDDIAITDGSQSTSYGKYDYMSGTSMATPVVTGTVALLAAVAPDMSAKQLRRYVLSNVRQTGNLTGYCNTGGSISLSDFTINKSRLESVFQSEYETNRETAYLSVTKTSVKIRHGKKVKVGFTAIPSSDCRNPEKVTVTTNKSYVATARVSGKKIVIKANKYAKKYSCKIKVTSGDYSKSIKVKVK